jgi:hypothetical protein
MTEDGHCMHPSKRRKVGNNYIKYPLPTEN